MLLPAETRAAIRAEVPFSPLGFAELRTQNHIALNAMESSASKACELRMDGVSYVEA